MDTEQTILNHLHILGLGESEAKLYVAGLSYDRGVGVSELQKQTGMKRPTIYHNLELLMGRGLVAKVAAMGGGSYTFLPPTQLERNIEAEVRAVRAKLQTLAQVSKLVEETTRTSSRQTLVQHFEGLQGVKTAVDMALFCSNPNWKVIAPIDNVFSQLDDRYAKYYIVTRKRHGIKAKTLWEAPDPEGRPLSRQEVADRQPRYLPQTMRGAFQSTTIIFDNKVVLLSSTNELSAIVIQSDEYSQLFNALFDGLWSASTPYGSM